MAYSAAKGLSISNSVAAEFVQEYFDYKMFAELGFKLDMNEISIYQVESFRCVVSGLNKFSREQMNKGQRKGAK